MEQWKSIPGFLAYDVSNMGNIRGWSFRRCLRKKPYIRKLNKQNKHLQIDLWINGRKYTKSVHRLVLMAFVGPCPENMECCHNDGNGENNHVENLRWDTQQENMNDMVRHGHTCKGRVRTTRNHNSILSENQVLEIRELFKKGVLVTQIADEYKGIVNYNAIIRVVNRVNYKYYD